MATDIIARGLAVSNSGGGGGSLDVGIEEGVGIKITGTDPKKISNDGVTNVTESASTAADGTIKVVFGNKSGEDATKNVAVKGLKNSAFTEKTTTIADTTDAVDTKLPTEKAVRTELNKKVNSSIVGDANGIATLDATKKLTSTQLPDHNHASDKINAMTGYTKPITTSAIDASTDTLNSAIGKLEKALDTKQASGTYATGNSAGDALKAVALNNTSAIGSTTQGVYIDANGKPQTMTYTLAQSVTADSKLTDTTYTQGNGIEISDTHVVKNTGVLAVKNSPSVDTEGKTVANGTFQVNTNGKIDYIGIKGLNSAAYKSVDEDTMTSSGTNLPTSKAVADYVGTEIGKLPTPMQFKGTVGTGGTVTVLPDASSSNTGYTYKVVTAGTYASQVAKIGDLFISNGTSWVYIPSADDEYTGENLLMTNYSKGTQPASTVVSNTDTANEAVQKIEWALDSKVNTSTTVNDKALSANVTLGGNDVAVTTGEYNIDTAKSTISGSTKINDAIEQLDYRTNTLGSAAYKDVDTTPTSGSGKLVTSGGVKTALDNKANKTTISSVESTVSVNTVPECLGYAGVKMIGGKTQKCKNLFNFAEWKSKVTKATKGTLTYSDTKESFTITATEDDAYVNSYMSLSDMQFKVKPNTNYTLSWKSNGVNGDVFVFKNTTYYFYIKTSNSEFKATFTTDASETSVAIRFGIAKAGDSDTFSNIQLEEGTTATSYEPYHADLWNAPTEKIVSKGRNILSDTEWELGYLNASGETVVDAEGHRTKDFVPVKPNTTYYVCGSDVVVTKYNSNKGSFGSMSIEFWRESNRSFTTDSETYYIKVATPFTVDNWDKISVIEGTSNTSYFAPFKNEISLADITKNLPDYGCSAGSVYNVLDLENMKYYHNVKGKSLSEIEAWDTYNNGSEGISYFADFDDICPSETDVICKDYELVYDSWTVKYKSSFGVFSVHSSISRLYFRPKNSSITNADEFKTSVKDINVYYELKDDKKQVIDLTSILAPIACEQGGTITLANTHSLDVPNTICYKKEV